MNDMRCMSACLSAPQSILQIYTQGSVGIALLAWYIEVLVYITHSLTGFLCMYMIVYE